MAETFSDVCLKARVLSLTAEQGGPYSGSHSAFSPRKVTNPLAFHKEHVGLGSSWTVGWHVTGGLEIEATKISTEVGTTCRKFDVDDYSLDLKNLL